MGKKQDKEWKITLRLLAEVNKLEVPLAKKGSTRIRTKLKRKYKFHFRCQVSRIWKTQAGLHDRLFGTQIWCQLDL